MKHVSEPFEESTKSKLVTLNEKRCEIIFTDFKELPG